MVQRKGESPKPKRARYALFQDISHPIPIPGKEISVYSKDNTNFEELNGSLNNLAVDFLHTMLVSPSPL